MKLHIPTLETERLILRPHKLADLPECAAMWADPAITRFTIGQPASLQRTWVRLTSYLGHWQLMGYGYWAVEEKASSRFIGELGFADFKREMEPSIEGTPELGWVLASHAHGKGYATEALKTVVAWGDRHFGKQRTVCIITPDNTASINVAKKCGYREVSEAKNGDTPVILFARG